MVFTKEQQQQHVQRLQDMYNTGDPTSQQHAAEALKMQGVQPGSPAGGSPEKNGSGSAPQKTTSEAKPRTESEKREAARKLLGDIHRDLARRGDPGTPFRSTEQVDAWEAALEAGKTPVQDPATGNVYDKLALVKDYGKRGQFGSPTGEIAWDKFHRDAGIYSVQKMIDSGKAPGKSDFESIQKTYGKAAATEARKYYDEHKSYVRYGLAEQAIQPALKEDGTIDIKKLSNLIGGSDKRADAILKHLYALGLSGKDPIRIIEQARSIPEYERDPDSLGEHFQKGFFQKGTPTGFLLDMVPIVGTVRLTERYKDDGFSAGERAWLGASAALDALMIAPILKAGAIGAKQTQAIGRGARLKGAAGGLWQGTVAEVAAPATMIMHPIETIKGSAKGVLDLYENIARQSKIPLEGLEITTTTQRMPVELFESDDIGMAIRDEMTRRAMRGIDDPVVAGEIQAKISQIPLQKTGEPVAVHTSSDVRPFYEGATIQAGREGGLFVAPSIHTRFAKASAFGDAPKGGIPGSLIFRGDEWVDQLIGSGKVYTSPKGRVLEIEGILKPGSDVPPPSQILFTRDNSGDVMQLLVFGKPFTKAEIAKLKIAGMAETIGTMVKPGIAIKGGRPVSKAYDTVNDLRKSITEATEDLARARKAGDPDIIKTKADDLARLESDLADAMKQFDRVARGAAGRRGFSGAIAYTGLESSPLSTYRDTVKGRELGPGRVEMPAVDFTKPVGRGRDRQETRTQPVRDPVFGFIPIAEQIRQAEGEPKRGNTRSESPNKLKGGRGSTQERVLPTAKGPDTVTKSPLRIQPARAGVARPFDSSKTRVATPEMESQPIGSTEYGKPGKVAWRQGEVTENGKRKSVYVVASHDGRMINRGKGGVEVRVGNPPPGMKQGRTPQESLTVLGGKPPKQLHVRTGATKATVYDGRIITFKSGKTQGKIVRGPQPKIIRGKRR